MKTKINYLLISILTLLFFGFYSCKKYEQDSGLKLRSAKNRLTEKVWEISHFNQSLDYDSILSFVPTTLIFNKEVAVSVYNGGGNQDLKKNRTEYNALIINNRPLDLFWRFDENKDISLYAQPGVIQPIEDMKITYLSNNELRLEITQTLVDTIATSPLFYTINYRSND